MWNPPPPLVAPSKILGRSASPVSVASLPSGPSPPPDRSFGHPFDRDIGVYLGYNHVPCAGEESQNGFIPELNTITAMFTAVSTIVKEQNSVFGQRLQIKLLKDSF